MIGFGIALGIYSNVVGNSYSLINNKIFNRYDLNLKTNQEDTLIYKQNSRIQKKFDIEKYLKFYNYENSYFSTKKIKKDNKNILNEWLLLNSILYLDYKNINNNYNLNEYTNFKDNFNKLKNNQKDLNQINKSSDYLTRIINYKSHDYIIEDLKKDDEVILLARMILGEGEGCSKLEKIAIGYTALNRANDNKKWNGTTIKEALLKEYQYESLSDKSRLNILKNPLAYNPKEFLESLEVAEGIITNKYADPTNGATHFYNPRLMKNPPKWANSKKFEYIGKKEKYWYHLFYKEK